MITLSDLILNTDLLKQSFDIIIKESYSFCDGTILMEDLGFEFVTIVVAECDLRQEYLNSNLARHSRSRYASIYAYSNIIKEEMLTPKQRNLIEGTYKKFPVVRIRVQLMIDTESPKEDSPKDKNSKVFSFRTFLLMSDYIIPRVQHVQFPKKDEYGNWNFNFTGVGSMTKTVR